MFFVTFDCFLHFAQIWDTAGQERFRTITTAYYRGAMGIFMVYDVTNEQSFENVRNWINQLDKHAADNCRRILIGNKAGQSDRVVETERGQALADEYSIQFFETDAKTNMNAKEMFAAMAREVLKTWPTEVKLSYTLTESRSKAFKCECPDCPECPDCICSCNCADRCRPDCLHDCCDCSGLSALTRSLSLLSGAAEPVPPELATPENVDVEAILGSADLAGDPVFASLHFSKHGIAPEAPRLRAMRFVLTLLGAAGDHYVSLHESAPPAEKKDLLHSASFTKPIVKKRKGRCNCSFSYLHEGLALYEPKTVAVYDLFGILLRSEWTSATAPSIEAFVAQTFKQKLLRWVLFFFTSGSFVVFCFG